MSHLCLLSVATLTLTSAGFAGSDTNADLQARLEAAEARISELSAAANTNWLNDARADEIRGLIHDVLADADTRASLQGSGATADYYNGFTIGSADGNWSLTMNGLLQTSWSNVDVDNAVGADTDGWGFNDPNSWMNFSGTIAGDFSYDVRYNWDTNTTEWANGSFDLGDGWGFTMGTFKVATDREDMIDDQYQLNLLNQATGTGLAGARAYTVGNGISLGYSGDEMRFWAQMYNYTPTAALPLAVGPVANDDQYVANFRLEYMVEGTWGQFDQFTSANGAASGTLVGISYNTVNSNDGFDGDSTLIVDAQLQFGGSNLYISYTDFSDDDGGAADWNETQVMYGMYLDDEWEVYARYVDDDRWDDDVLSIGVNNYWAGQNARWTTEITWDDHAVGTDTTVISSQLQFYF